MESLVPPLPTSLVSQKTEIQICVSPLDVKTWQLIEKNHCVGPIKYIYVLKCLRQRRRKAVQHASIQGF